jgi:uncharacterized membrane protein (UPF0127 family)
VSARQLLRNGGLLADCRVRLARTWWQRAIGLLATPRLDDPRGLWIAPCNSVHTIGMRYPIDVVFVAADARVLKLVRTLRPLRAAMCRGAHATLELRAGSIDELGLRAGDTIAPTA